MDWYSFFILGKGPGGYFTLVFVQHLLLTPLIIYFYTKVALSTSKQHAFLLILFAVSILIEFACVQLHMPYKVYRLFYGRYLFASTLGCYIVLHGFNRTSLFALSGISVIYITYTTHLNGDLTYFFNSNWQPQNAPAYFYTCLVIFFLWIFFSNYLNRFDHFRFLGKATYHILLIQTIWFINIKNLFNFDFFPLNATINLVACISGGFLFYLTTRGIDNCLHRPRAFKKTP